MATAAASGRPARVLIAQEVVLRQQAIVPLQVDGHPLALVGVAQADVRRVKAVLEKSRTGDKVNRIKPFSTELLNGQPHFISFSHANCGRAEVRMCNVLLAPGVNRHSTPKSYPSHMCVCVWN